jgi:hypothetical protein
MKKELEELNKLTRNKENCAELIKRLKSISLAGEYGFRHYLAITEHHAGRYTLGDIEKIIGEDKFKSAVESFEAKLTGELYKAVSDIDSQISKFTLSKTA